VCANFLGEICSKNLSTTYSGHSTTATNTQPPKTKLNQVVMMVRVVRPRRHCPRQRASR
ncbi:hypothetical protein ACLOJK_006810, partial [Asimina triloba]